MLLWAALVHDTFLTGAPGLSRSDRRRMPDRAPRRYGYTLAPGPESRDPGLLWVPCALGFGLGLPGSDVPWFPVMREAIDSGRGHTQAPKHIAEPVTPGVVRK